MGRVHQLPTSNESQSRLLEKWLSEAVQRHSDVDVAEKWLAMARETLGKYPGPPLPSTPELDLSDLSSINDVDRQYLIQIIDDYLQAYFNDVRGQLMQIHRDFLNLQKQLAEAQVMADRH